MDAKRNNFSLPVDSASSSIYIVFTGVLMEPARAQHRQHTYLFGSIKITLMLKMLSSILFIFGVGEKCREPGAGIVRRMRVRVSVSCTRAPTLNVRSYDGRPPTFHLQRFSPTVSPSMHP